MNTKLKNKMMILFNKAISLFVVLCFILSIANLPVYAKSDRRAKDNKEKNEQVIKTGKTDTSEIGLTTSEEAMRTGSGEGVNTMNRIGNMSEEEVDSIIEIDEQAGVVKDKKKNKVVAVYNAEKEQVLGYAGQSDIVYYQALVNRKKSFEKGETEKKKIGKIEKIGETERQEVKAEKNAEEEIKEETINKKEDEEKADIKGIEGENKEQLDVNQEYNRIISELSKQSGVSKEDVTKGLEDVLAGKTEKEKEEVIGLLANFLAQGGSIINCAVSALKEVLNVTSKGVLGLQALLVEISTGLFVKNNKDLINAGETQLMTSMLTIQSVSEQFGQETLGYAVDMDSFAEGLMPGESAIVWVNGDHYITVSKLENGNFTISDPNVRNGDKVEYSVQVLKAILSGKEGRDIDGQEVGVSYKAEGKDGKIRVLSASEGLQEQVKEGRSEKLSIEDMKEITGAKTVTKTVTRTVTVEKTKTVTVQKTRTVTKTATATDVDENGNKYTYEYTYEEEETYEDTEEVTYTEEEEVTETITEEVPDDTDEEEWGAKKEEEWNKQIDELTDPETGKIKGEDLDKALEGKDVERKVLSSDEEEKTQEGIDKCNERLAKYDKMSDAEFIAAMESGEVNVVSSKVIKVNSISVNGEKADSGFVAQVNKNLDNSSGESAIEVINNAINNTINNVSTEQITKTGLSITDNSQGTTATITATIEEKNVSEQQTTLSYADENGKVITIDGDAKPITWEEFMNPDEQQEFQKDEEEPIQEFQIYEQEPEVISYFDFSVRQINPDFSFDEYKDEFINAVNNGTLAEFVAGNDVDYGMFTNELENDSEKSNALLNELGIDGLGKMHEAYNSNPDVSDMFSALESNVDFDTYNSLLKDAKEQDKINLLFNCIDHKCQNIEEFCKNEGQRNAILDTLGVEGVSKLFAMFDKSGHTKDRVILEFEFAQNEAFRAKAEAEGSQDLFKHYDTGNLTKTESGLKYTFDNLTPEEQEALNFISNYIEDNNYTKHADTSYEDIISNLTDFGENETIFKVLTNDTFDQIFGSNNETRYQMAVAVTEYINAYCKHCGLENPSEMSSEDLNNMIEVVTTAYDNYIQNVSSNVMLDENTIVLSLAGDINRGYSHEPFSTTGFVDLLTKIGQDENLRTFFNYGNQDSEEIKTNFLNAISNLTVDDPNQRVFINIQAHGAKNLFEIEEGVYVTVEELADAFVQMHGNGVDLSNVCIGITSCEGYYSMTDFYNRLEGAGIDSLPTIYAEAGLETETAYVYYLDNGNKRNIEDSRFYQGLLSVVSDGENVTIGDFYEVNNTSTDSNATMFVPLNDNMFERINDEMQSIVSNYVDASSIPEDNFTKYTNSKGKVVYSNTSFPIDIFAYSIFSKEQSEELNEKAAVWEEVVFRAVPSIVAALYDKEGGQETFSAYQEAFVYAHALSKWISNDGNVRDEMSFSELVDSTRQEMGKGTEVLAGIYEEAIETAKGLTGDEAREVIINATLEAIGLHQAYNRGMISKEEFENGTYSDGIIDAALATLGVDRGTVENLVDQSLYILGYSDTEVDSQYMDMAQTYKKTDDLLQGNNPGGMKALSIQKTVSDVVMPEVTGTTGTYLAKTTDLVSSLFANTSNKDVQVGKDAQELFDYLQTTNMAYSPDTPEECQQSIDFSNTSEVLEQVQQALEMYGETFGVEVDSDTQIVLMSGTKVDVVAACACSEMNTIIIPVDNFDSVPDAGYLFTKIAHEYTHILNSPKVQSGEMTVMEDEVMATERGIIADTDPDHPKNLTIQTMYNGEQTVNFVAGMELSCFYSIMNNYEEAVDMFKQLTGNDNIQFSDIYYYDVIYGENKFGIPTSEKVGETEVGITLEYNGIKILYITDTGMNVNGTYENISVDGEVSHRVELLGMVADKDIIETTMGYYTNGTFTHDDIIDSFELVTVSEALIGACGREFGFSMDSLQYVCYDFPTDSVYEENGDIIRFYLLDENTNNTYTVDVKKDMGIVQLADATNGETIWSARESLSKPFEQQSSGVSSDNGGRVMLSSTIMSTIPQVSNYEYIHNLSSADLQNIVDDSDVDVTTRYLAFLELKEQGESVIVPDDMKDAAKEYLASLMTGEEILITDEESENGLYENATDKLKAALAMVYDIMLDSYIGEFNIDDEVIEQIWSDIYNNTSIKDYQDGFAVSTFSFQVEAMMPDIMAHEIMHNITDEYLGEDKNMSERAFGEFSSDVARLILCEQLGVDLTQDVKDEYKEDAGYMRVGATPIEEHYMARGVLGILIETSIKLEISMDWDGMMSAVAQCLQTESFRDNMDNNDYSQAMAQLLTQYVAVSTGNHSAVIVSTKNETSELCQNILKMFNFAQF
ncbi:MAG: hypothetical protein IKN62_00220 [Elusimicrobia bacterium]|nr:hypothetical protein [Elusimicrobiota bacterium]